MWWLISQDSTPAVVVLLFAMKFAHDFRETLGREGMSTPLLIVGYNNLLTTLADFPKHWVDLAVPYGQLKKCLKRVQQELIELGLDHETLVQLRDSNTASPVALKYNLLANGPLQELGTDSRVAN
jgi:E3 ubiquitin-protein ligase BAH